MKKIIICYKMLEYVDEKNFTETKKHCKIKLLNQKLQFLIYFKKFLILRNSKNKQNLIGGVYAFEL